MEISTVSTCFFLSVVVGREGGCPVLAHLSSCFSTTLLGARSVWAAPGDVTGASSSTSAPTRQPVRKESSSTMKGCVPFSVRQGWTSLLWGIAMGSNRKCLSSLSFITHFSSFFPFTPPCCFSLGPAANFKRVSFFSSSSHQILYRSPYGGHKTHHCACGTEHCVPHRAQPRHSLCDLRFNDRAYRNLLLHVLNSFNRSSVSPGCHRSPPATTSRQTCCHSARHNFSCCICPHQSVQKRGSRSPAHRRASHCPGAVGHRPTHHCSSYSSAHNRTSSDTFPSRHQFQVASQFFSYHRSPDICHPISPAPQRGARGACCLWWLSWFPGNQNSCFRAPAVSSPRLAAGGRHGAPGHGGLDGFAAGWEWDVSLLCFHSSVGWWRFFREGCPWLTQDPPPWPRLSVWCPWVLGGGKLLDFRICSLRL